MPSVSDPLTLTENLDGLSIIVPCFRTTGTMRTLVSDFELAMPSGTYEVILVDDGCDEGGGDLARDLAQQYPNVRAVSVPSNYGQHLATLVGIQVSRYDRCLTLDADLEVSVQEALTLLELPIQGDEIAYGIRASDPRATGRRAASRLSKFLYRELTDIRFEEVSSCRYFRKTLLSNFTLEGAKYFNLDIALSRRAFTALTVPLEYRRRQTGRSAYSIMRLLRHAVKLVLTSRKGVLRIAAAIAWSVILANLTLGIVGLRLLYVGQTPPGYLSMVFLFLFLSSAQVLLLASFVRLQALQAQAIVWREW